MEPLQALKLLVSILNQTTMINRGGRESGLTADERGGINQSTQIVAKALDDAAAAQKALNETKDDLAQIRAELDQVKAELGEPKPTA